MSVPDRDTHDVELDRTAWNLPSPPSLPEVRQPSGMEWPPWPFGADAADSRQIDGELAELKARLPES
jgi:hypothetical protein